MDRGGSRAARVQSKGQILHGNPHQRPIAPTVTDSRRIERILEAREGVMGPLALDYTRHAVHAMEERLDS